MYSYFEKIIQDNVNGISDLQYLANGSFGIVFKAKWNQIQDYVAIKISKIEPNF